MITELRKLMFRIGHRGAFLLFLFMLDELFAYSLLVDTPRGNIHWLIAPHIWAVIWAVAGFICLSGVIFRTDAAQFSVAAFVKFGWAVTWFRIELYNDVPRAWIQGVIWLAFAAITIIVATWTEPPRYQRIRKSKKELE